jgi:hypothetical protein
MSEVCGDNRYELIGEFKGKLVEGTNIETSPEEMAVLDNILFRFWQMGWLDKLKAQEQKCRECGEATSKAIQELQAKLKAQEPVQPVKVNRYMETDENGDWYVPETYDCGNCGVELHGRANYCHLCGREVKWNG